MLFEPDRVRKMLAAREGGENCCVTAEVGFIDVDGKKMPPSRTPNVVCNPKNSQLRLKRAAQFYREWRTGQKEDKPYHPQVVVPGYANIAQA